MKLLFFIISFIFLYPIFAVCQNDDVWIEPNRGQWDSEILYRIGLLKGDFFVGKEGFTFALNNLGDVYHNAHQSTISEDVHYHTITSNFLNTSWAGKIIESDSSAFYKNYMLGNKPEKWVSKIHSIKKIELIDYYPGINLILETFPDRIKYSFEVKPGANASIIQMKLEGMDSLLVTPKEVAIGTRFGQFYQKGLQAWAGTQNEKGTNVPITFKSENNILSFDFPDGYDTTQPLLIDPDLIFSTFTGASSDNWGFTAAPDNEGNLFAGGIVFGPNYPTTTGVYDISYNGGEGIHKIDICISKFSSDGTQLLYSTFLGGDGNETPNSIISNHNNELYILGVSTSSDFPTSSTAFQPQWNGGTIANEINIKFSGTDIILSQLSSDGTSLLASTYLGGSMNDGLNVSDLNYNYGDVFRGEIILDNNGDVVIASSTRSSDFPIINGANATLNGLQDGVVVKMTPNLSTIIWSTYIGGSKDDAAFSLKASSTNNIYVTGGTKSTNMSFSNGFSTSYQGGMSDGYIVELDGATSQLLRGTYVGTNSYDQTFFIDVDADDNVYVFGQSSGNIPITPGVFNKPNSGQFIQQYSSDLSSRIWSTVIGGGNNRVEISPTAFNVTDCNEIYFTGWGGQVNSSNSQATGSTSVGFPTTSDAYQSNTNGNNFYIGILSENAQNLVYGSFMGGLASSYNHVDGGTSRFDKNGSIYHAVCGACGGNAHGFTTTPGVYSETNNSSNCNMAAWKFDLGSIHSNFMATTNVCLPDSAHFENNSSPNMTYHWSFGDGTTSTAYEPTHYYDAIGDYEVMLVVSDNAGCFESDTSYTTITVSQFEGAVIAPTDTICPGTPYQLEAMNGTNYSWFPAEVLDDSHSATPIATIDETTTFAVAITDACGTDTLYVTLNVYGANITISEEQEICKGDKVTLSSQGGNDYEWISSDPGSIVGASNNSSIDVAPVVNTTYTVIVTTEEGCQISKDVLVTVVQDVPHPDLTNYAFTCFGDPIQVTVTGTEIRNILWSPEEHISDPTQATITIAPPQSDWYYVTLSNVCGDTIDSVFIEVITPHSYAGNDTIVCPGESVYLWATGGVSYQWTPPEFVQSPNSDITRATPTAPTVFTVYVTDEYGCSSSSSVTVEHFPAPWVFATSDFYGFVGDPVPLNANGSSYGSYEWTPTDYLSCTNCPNPIATPPGPMTYLVTFTDKNGCIAQDTTRINFDALIYVPNSFTPNDNEYNDYFLAFGGNFKDFTMLIFNRWGELIFESHDIGIGWDGTYGGMLSPDGTYVWKITYTDLADEKYTIVGHVNLLR